MGLTSVLYVYSTGGKCYIKFRLTTIVSDNKNNLSFKRRTRARSQQIHENYEKINNNRRVKSLKNSIV